MTLPPGTAPATAAPAAGPAGQEPRPRHRTDPWKAAFFVLAAVAIVAGVTWALLGSKFLVVRSVHVAGGPGIPRSQILEASGVQAGTPLIRVSTGTIARRVERLTLVQSATVSRSWPGTVVITVVQRTAVVAVPAGSGYELVDRFGVVLRQSSRLPANMPVLQTPAGADPAQLRGSPAVLAAATVDHQLPPGLARRVISVSASDADDVTLHLRRGLTIVWGSATHPATKARELKTLMRGHAHYFDVSDPHAVVTAPHA
jgi:cell division protein FtsQ